ncbi:GNAT family N-acetyltransferase [Streptomyces sp. NPDC059850]|uniref:GNAT family N-acetyltransferase n=1 Tax=Streptomyces sp. NPDC059850 TaxID=3346970 RepID=UPI00365B2DCD
MSSVLEGITIRPADKTEADLIASMWAEASQWLKSRGLDQWQYPADAEKIARDIERGNAYVAHRVRNHQNAIEYVGTITVDNFADPEFWTAHDNPDEALYGHRIITLPELRGQAVGLTLLDWASVKAEEEGKKWFRVDAWKTNAELGSYYERQGFEHVRTVDLPHRRSGALYQRRAGMVSDRAPKFVGSET